MKLRIEQLRFSALLLGRKHEFNGWVALHRRTLRAMAPSSVERVETHTRKVELCRAVPETVHSHVYAVHSSCLSSGDDSPELVHFVICVDAD